MKKLFYLLFAMCAVMFTACSSDDDNKTEIPQLNLEKSNYTLASGTVDIKLIADAPATSNISIPVTFSGRATEGTDFTASAKEDRKSTRLNSSHPSSSRMPSSA